MPGAIPAAGQRQVGSIPSGDAATQLRGPIVDRPAASPSNNGYQFAASDTEVLYWSDGSTWTAVADIGGTGGGGAWGDITGTLSDQTDLQAALDAKQNSSSALTAARYYATERRIFQ